MGGNILLPTLNADRLTATLPVWMRSASRDLLWFFFWRLVWVFFRWLAPHHGSKTSSTAAFVAQVEPADVVFSTGYKHQFGHPHADVVSRYRAVGSRLWNTAEQGGLSFIWTGSGTFLAKANGSSKAQLKVESARQDGRQYWWRSTSVYQGGIMVESALIGGH